MGYASYALFRGFAVEVLVVGFGVGAGGMNNAVTVVGRSIERVKLQRNISGIDDIVIGPGRDDYRETGSDRGADPVENRFARAFFHPEELVELVDFHSDFLLGVERHDDELAVLSRIEYLAELLIADGETFNILYESCFHSVFLLVLKITGRNDHGQWGISLPDIFLCRSVRQTLAYLMFITGLGTTSPSQRYAQREIWSELQDWQEFPRLKTRSKTILQKVLCRDNGIDTRHLALDPLTEVFNQTPDALQSRFTRHAPALATQAARNALEDAGCLAVEIDAVLVSTCTGYLCPGLTSYLSECLGLRPNVFALDLVGQGCGAALPNLRTGEAILAAGRARRILSVCVEICSAAFYIDDDPGVLISACLFGDGAGAAVLSNEPLPGRRQVEWKFTDSRLVPAERDTLRFAHKNGMLRNILLPQVPQIASSIAEQLFEESLVAAGVKREQITGWVLHTGGRDVILALRDKLRLSAHDMRHGSAVLREFGNISSPTVYFILERALNDTVPDGLWWMSAFGAGFSCHGAMLEVLTP